MPQKNDESSIIEIIEKMISKGETDEIILKTLKELGVEKEQARKLLSQGKENDRAKMSGDVIRAIRSDIEKEKVGLKKLVGEEVRTTTAGIEKQILASAISSLQGYERDMENQTQVFREQTNDNINKVNQLSERVKEKLNELGSAVRQVQIDMDELKVRGIGTRNKHISSLLILLGVAFALIDLYLLLTTYQSAAASIDSIITMVLIALTAITMLFVSTLI